MELESPDLSKTANTTVIGRVEAIHIEDEVIRDGLVDLRLVKPIGRLGYRVAEDPFPLDQPPWPSGPKQSNDPRLIDTIEHRITAFVGRTAGAPTEAMRTCS